MATTITKRVNALAAGGATSRVSTAALSATATKRVGATASGGETRRVNLGAHHSSFDCWGGSWGRTWGLSWQNFLSASELSENITLRVTESALRHGFISLESSGYLLREDGSYLLREGEANVPNVGHTKRVTL